MSVWRESLLQKGREGGWPNCIRSKSGGLRPMQVLLGVLGSDSTCSGTSPLSHGVPLQHSVKPWPKKWRKAEMEGASVLGAPVFVAPARQEHVGEGHNAPPCPVMPSLPLEGRLLGGLTNRTFRSTGHDLYLCCPTGWPFSHPSVTPEPLK